MKEISYVVNNTLGIHARPAALLAQCCVNFKSQVRIYLDEKVADGDNVLQILALGAKKGDTLRLISMVMTKKLQQKQLKNYYMVLLKKRNL